MKYILNDEFIQDKYFTHIKEELIFLYMWRRHRTYDYRRNEMRSLRRKEEEHVELLSGVMGGESEESLNIHHPQLLLPAIRDQVHIATSCICDLCISRILTQLVYTLLRDAR